MFGFLGQPSRSGYCDGYDDLDDAPERSSTPWADLLTLPLIAVFIFFYPLIPPIVMIVQLFSKALGITKDQVESKKP